MKRKLVKQGKSTLTVGLPHNWIKEKQLAAGDEVDISIVDNGLLVTGKGVAGLRWKELDLGKTTKSHFRSALASAYKAGYDEITVRFDSPLKLAEINAVVSSLTGLEVVSHKEKSVVIKSFLGDTDETASLILKLFQTTKYAATQAYDGVDEKEMHALVKINTRKLRDLCLRSIHINKFGGDKSYDYYDLVTVLEKIATTFYYNVAMEQKVKKEIVSLLDEALVCYMKKDYSRTSKLWLRVTDKLATGRKTKEYHILELYQHLLSRLLSVSH